MKDQIWFVHQKFMQCLPNSRIAHLKAITQQKFPILRYYFNEIQKLGNYCAPPPSQQRARLSGMLLKRNVLAISFHRTVFIRFPVPSRTVLSLFLQILHCSPLLTILLSQSFSLLLILVPHNALFEDRSLWPRGVTPLCVTFTSSIGAAVLLLCLGHNVDFGRAVAESTISQPRYSTNFSRSSERDRVGEFPGSGNSLNSPSLAHQEPTPVLPHCSVQLTVTNDGCSDIISKNRDSLVLCNISRLADAVPGASIVAYCLIKSSDFRPALSNRISRL
ncbi:hypothetical protein RRG08_013395 [Elysia crispata]|uniref:Uncharacterized protein n=1 Tax=Elysia crispata TaxID=231223 RepID=A0AAE1B6Y5_9GAST|nr:hypothetical protein RRG08_013395 [Elysia crispata]